jgi:polysaccharide biosynthesis protein PslG
MVKPVQHPISTLALVGVLIVSLLTACTLPQATPIPTTRPTDLGANLITDPVFPSLGYGVQVFLWWNAHTRARDLEDVRRMRFTYVKQIFGWRDIEPFADQPPDWSESDAVMDEITYRQIEVIARLGKPPDWALRTPTSPDDPPFDVERFGVYCGMLAERYKGRIAGYQVWNEPNLSREWGGYTPNAAAYVKLLKPCHAAIKAADPDAQVITAGLAPTGDWSANAVFDDMYLLHMFEAGVSDYYDVLGLNAPGYASAPETAPDAPELQGHRWQAFRHVEDMRAIQVQQGDGEKQIAILEMGWTTDARDTIMNNGTEVPNPYWWHAISEEQQADYLVRAYRYAALNWRPWMSLMITIYIPDPGWTPDREEYWWALSDAGFNTRYRPAYIDLANMERWINDVYMPAIDPGANPYTPMPPRP